METARTALVTGSSKGIGRAIARRLQSDGYRVVGVQRSTLGISADLREYRKIPEIWRKAVGEAGSAPKLVVLNAGRCTGGRFIDLSTDDCLAMLELNLVSPLLFAREVLGTWVEQGIAGHLVLVGSQAGLPGFNRPGDAAYAVTKGGIHAMVGPLASEYGPLIRVNAIAPGDVATAAEFAALAGAAKDAGRTLRERKREISSRTPIGRWIRPREVAEAVMFVENCSAMSGAIINVSGGASAH